jgi:hypothetical protein
MSIGEHSAYVRLTFDDVELGVPLHTQLYDGNRRVLFKRGDVIETAHQLEELLLHGLYRNTSERHSPLAGLASQTAAAPRCRQPRAMPSRVWMPPSCASAIRCTCKARPKRRVWSSS